MLPQKVIDRLAALAKVKPADLSAAIAAEAETDIAIDEKVVSFGETELQTLKSNSYGEGKKAGSEIDIKEAKEKHGLEFTGKNIDALIEAAQKKAVADAKVEPGKQVADLTEKLATAQKTANELQAQLTAKDGEISYSKTQNLVMKDLPSNTTLPANKVLLLMKEDGYDYKNEDGKIIWHKDGKPLTDAVGNNLDTKAVSLSYVTENKLAVDAADPGGRGGNDSKGAGGKFTSLSDIKKSFEDQKKSTLGAEFSEAVTKAAKENPEFAMDK